MTAATLERPVDDRPSAPSFRHASGDDEHGCLACWFDVMAADTDDLVRICRTPEPDPDEPDLCAICSHTVEPVG